MANNYLQFSEVFSFVGSEQREWFERFLPLLQQDALEEEEHGLRLQDLRELTVFLKANQGVFDQLESEIENGCFVDYVIEKDEERDEELVWVKSEEGSDFFPFCCLLHIFMHRFGVNDPWWLTWASWCSQPRVSEFSGGAVVVSLRGVWAHSVDDWVGKQLEILREDENPPVSFDCGRCNNKKLSTSFLHEIAGIAVCPSCFTLAMDEIKQAEDLEARKERNA